MEACGPQILSVRQNPAMRFDNSRAALRGNLACIVGRAGYQQRRSHQPGHRLTGNRICSASFWAMMVAVIFKRTLSSVIREPNHNLRIASTPPSSKRIENSGAGFARHVTMRRYH